jgi:acyl phosphate:glycerol-3-phosphate acyltransferase
MLWIISGIIISYLVGSIPTAFIFGKLLKGLDIRKFGSGNVGATNALRVLGKRVGVLVLILDILKGVISIILAEFFIPEVNLSADLIRVLFGVSCICGHNWTIFLNFKGGKGIATTLGVLIGLALKTPGLGKILLLLISIWFVIFVLWRIVSLASVLSAIALPILAVIFKLPPVIIVVSFVLSFFVLLRHKSNIIRLLKGKEAKLYFGKRS